jgi:hypothetical protein
MPSDQKVSAFRTFSTGWTEKRRSFPYLFDKTGHRRHSDPGILSNGADTRRVGIREATRPRESWADWFGPFVSLPTVLNQITTQFSNDM